MDDEGQDSLREEQRRQVPLPKWGQWRFYGREAGSGPGFLTRFVLLLLLIGAAIWLLLPGLGR